MTALPSGAAAAAGATGRRIGGEPIFVDLDRVGMANLQRFLGGAGPRLRREVAIVINKTARRERGQIARRIRKRVAIKQKDIRPHIKLTARASSRRLVARLTLSRSARLPLKYFGARQTRKGVSYKIDRRGKRRTVPRAFISAELGGHAFRRQTRGGSRFTEGNEKLVGRLPILKLKGISPWGAYVRNPDIERETRESIEQELAKGFARRLRFLQLRASGGLRGRRP